MNLIAPPFQKIKNQWARENLANLPLVLVLALLSVHVFNYLIPGGIFEWKGSVITFANFIAGSFGAINALFIVRKRLCKKEPYSFRSFTIQLIAMLLGGFAGVALVIVTNYLADFRPLKPGYTFTITLLHALMPVPVVGIPILLVYFRKGIIELKVKEKELGIAKMQQLRKKADLQSLQAKINPHFLYNSLNCAASLVKTDAKKADELIINLSGFFRYSMNSGEEFFASVRDELAIVRTYVSIEQVRYADWLSMNYEIGVSLLNQPIPRFLLQPLVENAIRQNVAAHQEKAVIHLRIYGRDRNLHIEIENSGSFLPENLESEYDLINIKSRLSLLLGETYDLQIKSGQRRVLCIILFNYQEIGKKAVEKEVLYE
jgi:two-component system, LytTR family, sensor kinase